MGEGGAGGGVVFPLVGRHHPGGLGTASRFVAVGKHRIRNKKKRAAKNAMHTLIN